MEDQSNSNIPEFDKDTKMWGMLCHLSALSALIGIPLGNIVGPLIIWLIKKDQYAFVDDQGKESLNFQISMTIFAAASAILIFLLIGIPILIAVIVIDLIFTIIASIRANEGIYYRYPFSIKIIK